MCRSTSRPVDPTLPDGASTHPHHGRGGGWRIDVAAEKLGVHRATCERDIWRFGLERPPEHAPFSATPRTAIVYALERFNWDSKETAAHFGVSPSHLCLVLRQKSIKCPPKTPSRDPEQLRRLVDALRLGNGVVLRAARILGVSCRTIDKWCEKYDINPREYRRAAR